MAIALKDQQQEDACVEVNRLLECVTELNAAILAKDAQFAVTYSGNKKARICLDTNMNDKVIAILLRQRIATIKELTSLSTKFRIGLSDEELARISDSAIA